MSDITLLLRTKIKKRSDGRRYIQVKRDIDRGDVIAGDHRCSNVVFFGEILHRKMERMGWYESWLDWGRGEINRVIMLPHPAVEIIRDHAFYSEIHLTLPAD